MFLISLIFVICLAAGIMWLTVGDELSSMIGSAVDYLMHPLERKLRHARKISCE